MDKLSARSIYRVFFIVAVFVLLFFFSTPFNEYVMRKVTAIVGASQKVIDSTGVKFSTVSKTKSKPKEKKKGGSWNFNVPFFSKKPPPDPVADRNPYIPIPQRITVSHIEGDNNPQCYATNYSALELLFGGEYVPGKFLPMIDIRGDRFDDTTYAASAGIITRIVPDKNSTFCRMLGFNAFYDYRQGNLGYYNQLGLGLEILGKRWDFRGNLYVPFGAKRRTLHCVFDDYDGPYFAINDLFESVSYSFNAEVGWLAINSQYILLYLAGGPYYISGRKCHDRTRGGQFRIQPQYKDFIAINASVSHDPLFETVYQVEVIVHLPLYLLSKKISKKETCGLTARQIYQPVSRFEVMPLGRCSCWTTNF